MTEEQINELERLAARATPGPWFVTCNCTGKTFYTIKNDRVYVGEALGVYNGDANATYIVAACNSVPELIKRVRELERQRDALALVIDGDLHCSSCRFFDKHHNCSIRMDNIDRVHACSEMILEHFSSNAAKEAGK